MAANTYLAGTFLVLSFWILCVASQKCPPAENLTPCTCNDDSGPEIRCSHITRMEAINEALERSGDIRFRWFVLENSTLMFLPAQYLISKRIDGLMIMHTRLMGLFDGTPSSSNTLRFFWLDNVVIQRGIKWDYFKKMVKLEQIQILNTNVKTLGKDFTENVPPGITNLELRYTKTSKLADGVFVGLNKLRMIRMDNNKIKVLKRNFFDTPCKVNSLSFNDNLIESLPDDMFTEMPSLWHLSLEKNKITKLPENLYLPAFDNLRFANINGNPIVCDCQIEWVTRSEIKDKIRGTCGDKSIVKKGMDFDLLTEQDFEYCHN